MNWEIGPFKFLTTATPAEGDLITWDNTNKWMRIRTLATAIAHAITSTIHTASNWKVLYSNGSGVITELSLGVVGTILRANGVASAPTFGTVISSTNSRVVAVNTSYQPSTTRDVLVSVSVSIVTAAADDGKIEALCDSADPPTTVVGMVRSATSAETITAPLVFLCPTGYFYRLKTTQNAGTPTFAVAVNAQEYLL